MLSFYFVNTVMMMMMMIIIIIIIVDDPGLTKNKLSLMQKLRIETVE